MKILAIQFKYLGDAVILTPALKALKTQIPNAELQVLVAAEAAPLLENLPWISKVWAMPRSRGKAKLAQALPFIRALRQEKFDQSIDFGSNDRGALLSFLSGAKLRLGATEKKPAKRLQRIAYTQIVERKQPSAPYFDLHFELLSAWQISRPPILKLETACKAESSLTRLLPQNAIICHIGTSQQKKDWPITHWAALDALANRAGLTLFFSAGNNERERNLIHDLKKIRPNAQLLPSLAGLPQFLCLLQSAHLFVCGDTGPLHFAEGLGVPVLGIFGVGNSVRQVAPIYRQQQLICSSNCACDAIDNHADYCQSANACMASIQPNAVFLKIQAMLNRNDTN